MQLRRPPCGSGQRSKKDCFMNTEPVASLQCCACLVIFKEVTRPHRLRLISSLTKQWRTVAPYLTVASLPVSHDLHPLAIGGMYRDGRSRQKTSQELCLAYSEIPLAAPDMRASALDIRFAAAFQQRSHRKHDPISEPPPHFY